MRLTVVLIAETRSNFISALKKHYVLHIVRSGTQGIAKVTETNADVIVLDAISLKTSGIRICKQLRHEFPDKHIIHIHAGEEKRVDSPANTVLCSPVTTRKLLASVDLISPKAPDNHLTCGDFTLDLARRVLIAHDSETILTPKEAALVEAFLRHPNHTLERKWIMQHIWQTEYTGDTRTLNVHIRAVREAMEKNASKPQYIKTVRGIGYRFEIALNKKTDQ